DDQLPVLEDWDLPERVQAAKRRLAIGAVQDVDLDLLVRDALLAQHDAHATRDDGEWMPVQAEHRRRARSVRAALRERPHLVGPSGEGCDPGRTSTGHLIDAEDRVDRDVCALDALELGPQPLLGGIDDDAGTLAEEQALDLDEAEHRARRDRARVD